MLPFTDKPLRNYQGATNALIGIILVNQELNNRNGLKLGDRELVSAIACYDISIQRDIFTQREVTDYLNSIGFVVTQKHNRNYMSRLASEGLLNKNTTGNGQYDPVLYSATPQLKGLMARLGFFIGATAKKHKLALMRVKMGKL